jgi:hypothetical protein
VIDHHKKALYSSAMAENMIFDRLASGIPLDERQNLLQKLKSQSYISGQHLYFEDKERVPAGDIAAEFSALPWYSRLWYFFLSFFKAKPPVDIFGDHQISILGQKIDERSPGLYDYHGRMLLPAFYRQIEKLKEASRFFYSALDTSVNRDRGAFFAFMGSLEMVEVHKRLQEETEPKVILEKNPDAPEPELRQIAFKAMDDALALITEEQRNTMYFASRSLNCLKGLSSFLFDRLIMASSFSHALNGPTGSVNVVRELLISLNNILLSLKVVPPMTLLQSLFVFILQDRAAEPGFDSNREIRLLLAKAEESLTVIQDFNKIVPLAWIIRCASRNMSFVPREISGGEDWFVVYRDYWKRRTEFLFADYMRDRRRRELLSAFRLFFNDQNLKTLENAQSDSNPDGLPVKGSFALSFLLTFYSVVFMHSMNKILRPILIDGEFHKKENRVEFAESYNTFIKLEDEIKKFEQDISPSGDYGKRYIQARQEMSALPVKRRKIQIVLEDAQEDAEKILGQVREASLSMLNLLGGFLGRDPRGRYDILSNFSTIAGKGSQFINGLNETLQQFQMLVKLLEDIEAMEDGR